MSFINLYADQYVHTGKRLMEEVFRTLQEQTQTLNANRLPIIKNYLFSDHRCRFNWKHQHLIVHIDEWKCDALIHQLMFGIRQEVKAAVFKPDQSFRSDQRLSDWKHVKQLLIHGWRKQRHYLYTVTKTDINANRTTAAETKGFYIKWLESI